MAKSITSGNTTESPPVRWILIVAAMTYVLLFLLLPLILVFYSAFERGFGEYWAVLCRSDTINSIFMTLTTVCIAVPANIIFGVVAAWCIGKFNFWGKSCLISLIDLPFAVSPVIAGLLFVILFGLRSPLGGWLDEQGIRIVYSTAGAVLATMFVTFPFVARELIPIMQSQGTEEEYAARVLGANGLQIFFRVTLPNIKWALLYGIILCNARAMGEYGAVKVVCSGGKMNTMPLLIEELYHGSNPVAPFAVSTLLALVALLTLIAKAFIEAKTARKREQAEADSKT
ncbi:MAG: sulfate ABC transporter permease subunit CysW [Planctomycetia bacterium]|nr:sulfate ABC transporter permease subunit CysW [Planctomycetia bacterium]